MATITLFPAQTTTVDIDSLSLEKIIDSPSNFLITAVVVDIWREMILWQGQEEYEQAGIWTNESALARAKELIESGNVRFA